MAKKEIRSIVASEDIAAIVDKGGDVDVKLKNLSFEDKGIKTKLADVVKDEFSENETSVRLRGTTSTALISSSEKIEINTGAENFSVLKSIIDGGLLEGIVEKKLSLVVPSDQIEKAAEALRLAGINASVTETLLVSAESLRNNDNPSVERDNAVKILKECVNRDVTFKVKYDRI